MIISSNSENREPAGFPKFCQVFEILHKASSKRSDSVFLNNALIIVSIQGDFAFVHCMNFMIFVFEQHLLSIDCFAVKRHFL